MEAGERTMSCWWLHLPFMMARRNAFHWKVSTERRVVRTHIWDLCQGVGLIGHLGLAGLLGFTSSLFLPLSETHGCRLINTNVRTSGRQKRMVKNLNRCKWSGMMMKRRSWTPYRLPLCSVVPYLGFIKRFLIKISQFVLWASFWLHIFCPAYLWAWTKIRFLIFFILYVQTFFEL